jgi:hypothetical protein
VNTCALRVGFDVCHEAMQKYCLGVWAILFQVLLRDCTASDVDMRLLSLLCTSPDLSTFVGCYLASYSIRHRYDPYVNIYYEDLSYVANEKHIYF